jgi:hypothetical protein
MKIRIAGRTARNSAMEADSERAMRRVARGRIVGSLLLAGAACSAAAQNAPPSSDTNFVAPAQHGYIDLTAGLAYTDNALLVPSDTIHDGVAKAGFDVDYSRKGSELDFDVRGQIDRLEYLNHSFSGSYYGNLNGNAIWGRPTDLFQWLVQDSFGEGMIDPLAAPTPSALETINYFTTGPYLNLNFGPNDRATFFALYSRTSFEKSPYDSSTYDGGGTFAHALSGSSTISLQVSAARTRFDDPFSSAVSVISTPDSYNARTVSLIYSATLARTEVSATGGYSSVDFGGPTSAAPLLALQINRRVSPSSSLFVRAQSGYSTVGTSIQSNLSLPTPFGGTSAFGPRGVATSAAAPFKERNATVGWNFQRARTTFSLSGTYDEQIYAQQTLYNENDKRISLLLQRQLRPTVSAALNAYQRFANYDNLGSSLHATAVNLSLSKQFSRTSFSMYVQRTHQSASGSTFGSPFAATYDEDRVGLNVTYDLVGRRFPGGY